MQPTNNLPFFLFAVAIFIGLKFGFSAANNLHLAFLLGPTDYFVGLLTGSESIMSADHAYLHQNLNILIDKSCSGYNFMLLAFLLFTYVGVNNTEKSIHKLMVFPYALIGAYLLTIFVNTSRIFASIVVRSQTKHIFFTQQSIIHEAIGIFTNLTFLILAYLLLERFLIHKRHHAKLA